MSNRAEDEILDPSPEALKDRTQADSTASDPILSLMQRVDQFQSRLDSIRGSTQGAQRDARPSSSAEYSEAIGTYGDGNESDGDIPYSAEVDALVKDSPSFLRSQEEILRRLQRGLQKAEENLQTIKDLLQKALTEYKLEMDRWEREIESLEMLLSKMSPVEARWTQEFIEKLRQWRQRAKESTDRIQPGDEISSFAKLRTRQMKEQYGSLAALLLERYREMQRSHAAHPGIEAILMALVEIRDMAGRLLREDPHLIASLGEKMRDVLLEVSKESSALTLELREEPPPPPPADSLDPGDRLNPAVFNRMADYLIRNSRFPALFLDPETLYLRRLQKALYRALIDYHERLEGHRLRCCPEPAVFHGRFEDFVRLTVIPRMAKPLEEAARRLPEHTNHIQQLLKRILDLIIQGQASFTGSAAEPQIKASS